ncbi:MAG TPA: hypothetical protein VN944_03660 [Nitrospiria bacterium]|nr:hypothetical protein [Nitrospiria bacterium]
MSHFWIRIVLIPLLLLTGCRPFLKVPYQEAASPSQEILSLLMERDRQNQGMKALAAVSFSPGFGERFRFNGILSCQKEGNVRLQGFDPAGASLLDLVLSGDRYRISLKGEGTRRGRLDEKSRDDDEERWRHWLKIVREIPRKGNPLPAPGEEVLYEDYGGEKKFFLIDRKMARPRLIKIVTMSGDKLIPLREEIFSGETSGAGEAPVGVLSYEQYGSGGIESVWPGRIKAELPEGVLILDFIETYTTPRFEERFFGVGS